MYDPEYDDPAPEYTREDYEADKADRAYDEWQWQQAKPRKPKPLFGQDREPTVQRPLFLGANDLPGQQYLVDPFASQE